MLEELTNATQINILSGADFSINLHLLKVYIKAKNNVNVIK